MESSKRCLSGSRDRGWYEAGCVCSQHHELMSSAEHLASSATVRLRRCHTKHLEELHEKHDPSRNLLIFRDESGHHSIHMMRQVSYVGRCRYRLTFYVSHQPFLDPLRTLIYSTNLHNPLSILWLHTPQATTPSASYYGSLLVVRFPDRASTTRPRA